jgi:hypothetical protein
MNMILMSNELTFSKGYLSGISELLSMPLWALYIRLIEACEMLLSDFAAM